MPYRYRFLFTSLCLLLSLSIHGGLVMIWRGSERMAPPSMTALSEIDLSDMFFEDDSGFSEGLDSGTEETRPVVAAEASLSTTPDPPGPPISEASRPSPLRNKPEAPSPQGSLPSRSNADVSPEPSISSSSAESLSSTTATSEASPPAASTSAPSAQTSPTQPLPSTSPSNRDSARQTLTSETHVGAATMAPASGGSSSSTTQPSGGGASMAASALSMARQSGSAMGISDNHSSRAPRKLILAQAGNDYRSRQYAEDWRQKVQRVGKLNYPAGVDPAPLTGKVRLRVIIAADGSLHQVAVVRSSSSKALDEAAVRIVRMAAPYAPFPPSLRAEYDLIEISRYWSFTEVFSGNW